MDRRALGHFHSVLEYLLLAIGWARSWPSTKCKLHDWRQGYYKGCGSGAAAEMVGWRGRTDVWCWSAGSCWAGRGLGERPIQLPVQPHLAHMVSSGI